MKKAIIFGANGQDGFYLSKQLTARGFAVVGVSRRGEFLRARITDYSETTDLIKTQKPTHVFHLAANSTASHDAMFENHETIATGTLNLLEAVRLHAPAAKVFISGSALQFENSGAPINEQTPFSANDPYAVARIQSVFAARYFRSLGLQTYIGYFFNHDSFLRSERHVAKKISATAQRIAQGSAEVLEIGDPEAIKEWSYAGDITEAVMLLMESENIFEAVLGSGEGRSVMDWIKTCFDVAGVSPEKHFRIAQGYHSPYRSLVSDNSLLRSLGYSPRVSFEGLAKKLMLNEV